MVSNMRRRLVDVLKEVAIREEREQQYKKKYAKNESMAKANEAAIALFKSPDPVYRRMRPDESPRNITFIALLRVDRYLRRNGIDWPRFDWEALVEWIYTNWEQILRVLFTLLPLVLL